MAIRRRQQNGAPQGYGQQQGQSPFLDRSAEENGQGQAEPVVQMAHERNAPAAPAEPSFSEGFEQQPGMPPQASQLQMALQRQKVGGPQQATAAAQAFQPQQSTGSGQFGAGARLPQPPQYGQQLGPQQGGAPMAPTNQAPDLSGMASQMQAPQSSLADAARAAAANNYTDIAGAENIAAGNFQGQLEGFGNIDPGGERGSNTHKKLFGRIASRYDVTQPGAVRTLMQDPDFLAAFPDAKLVEHENADLIDFGDGNPVDVIRGAVAGGSGGGWQWGVDAGQGAPGGGIPMGAPQGTGTAGGDQLSAQLMAALQGGQQFGNGSVDINQLIEALGLQQQAQQYGE